MEIFMSDFKIGVMIDSFRSGIKEGIQKAKEIGAEGFQVYASRGECAPENMTPAKIAEFNDMVQSNGLVVSAICGDLGGHGFQIKEDNGWKIEKSKRIMDLALELHANVVTTHIGVVPPEMTDTRKIMAEACEELASYGDSLGAYFAIETGPEPSHVLKGFLDSLSARAVRVNFDPANLAMVIGEDIPGAVRNLKDYIVHTHAKDGIMLQKTDPRKIYGTFAGDIEDKLDVNEYFREVPLGEGSVDFDSYLAALREVGYNGFLTIEREVGQNPEQDIRMAVDFLKEKI